MNDKIAVVGAGQMGLGIAHAFLAAGCRVVMVDLRKEALEAARSSIEAILQEGVRRGKIEAAALESARERLVSSTDVREAASDCALLVETASENLQVKLDIIRTADEAAGADVVLATNTSALSITEIATASRRPERVVGMHFFNPVHKMRLVEIVRGLATADAAVETVRQWSERIGKTSIVVNEAPGFTTSRISALLGNEAMWMLSEGIATAEDIDTSLRLAFNHPMGPLELGDLTGWDTRLAVLKHLHATLGEKFRPCPLISKMVQAGRYGRKVGHGVYKYVDGVKVPNSGLRPY